MGVMRMKSVALLLALLLIAGLVSAAGAAETPLPRGSVTSLSLSASAASIETRGTTTLTAALTGTGEFDRAVTWSIVQGSGTLSATSGASVTFQASALSGPVTVRATSVADVTRFGEVTLQVSGGHVHVMPANELITAPVNYIDLEGKTLRFTPKTGGGYGLEMLPLNFWEPSGRTLAVETSVAPWPARGWKVALPFAFPFGGKSWDSLYVNYFGNLSFGRPEGDVYWAERSPWPDGTMRSLAATLDARAASGQEYIIAALWNYYHEEEPGSITVDSDAGSLIVTWNVRRMDGRIGFEEKTKPGLFQARLEPSGAIELRYKSLPERDGIVGLFPGVAGNTGTRLDHLDDPADAPHASVEIRAVDVYDQGTVLNFALTMESDLPARAEQGELMHRIFLEYGEKRCAVYTSLKSTLTAASDCGFTPGVSVSGKQLNLLVPRSGLGGATTVRWAGADVVWWSIDGRFDQIGFGQQRPISVPAYSLDLTVPAGRTFVGNAFEVFHYPAFPKRPEEIFPAIYRRFPPGDDLAVVYTDFRVDALFASGSSTGRVNHAVHGIGEAYARPRPATEFGSPRLQASMAPVYVGTPFLSETYTGEGHTVRHYGRGLDWIAHELVHSWASGLKFVNPVTKQVEPLYQDEPCKCHWSEWLHLPSHAQVNDEYGGTYHEHTIMWAGQGSYWSDNGDGTFTRYPKPYHFPAGLSALDLYVMGLIRPEEVPDTFLLTNVTELGRGRVRASKVPVRIGDIIAAMGPRLPGYDESQKRFTLGVYLLTEPGRAADPAMLKRTQELGAAIARHFGLITGNRMEVTLTR